MVGSESEKKKVLGAVHQTFDGVVEHSFVSDAERPVGARKNARFLNTFTRRTAGWTSRMNFMPMLSVTYGYARVSKADDEARNLETQLGILADHGIHEDLIFSDVASGRTMNRTDWTNLMSLVQPRDTIVVAFLDRFSRNFDEGVRIRAELTRSDIGIVAVRENIDTSDGSAAAKFFRRSMLTQGAYQVDSTSERIKLGLDQARAGGKRLGRPPALTPEQAEQCRRMTEEGAGVRRIARVMQCSPATVKKVLTIYLDG